MVYSVIKIVNGNYAIVSEHSDLQSAIVKFHDQCKTHWNASDVYDAVITILDNHLNTVGGYKEFIHHDQPVDSE